MKASDIKKGNVVEHNGGVYQIRDIERSSPQGRGGNVRFRFIMYSVPGGNKLDASFDGDDELREVEGVAFLVLREVHRHGGVRGRLLALHRAALGVALGGLHALLLHGVFTQFHLHATLAPHQFVPLIDRNYLYSFECISITF